MDIQVFARYLKGRGKKQHVVDGLVEQARRFEDYLAQQGKDVQSAAPADIEAYAASLDSAQPGRAHIHMRGIALYFKSIANQPLAECAHAIREQGTARERNAFSLADMRGVNADDIARLRAAGIVTVAQMVEAGKTPAARRQLAQQTGVALDAILEMVKLSDLSRIEGVKGIRARLYYDAGIDTLDKLAGQETESLLRLTADFVQRTGFAGIAPLPKEVRSTIATAKRLPRIVEY